MTLYNDQIDKSIAPQEVYMPQNEIHPQENALKSL
jgi:hypothetical protein